MTSVVFGHFRLRLVIKTYATRHCKLSTEGPKGVSSVPNRWLELITTAYRVTTSAMDADEPTVRPGSINLNLMLRWKKTCEATYGAVCNTRNSEYMTKQLQTINLVDVETLSLVTTSTSTKFVALSYDWGSVPMFKTQTSTIHIRPPGSLSGTNSNLIIPATIRDAIYLTRKLGEKYIWVD